MDAKELKRLRRSDLMEMLLELSKENEELRNKLEESERRFQDRQIMIEESGSIAEAALRLNRMFEDTQAACDQYEQNVRRRCQQMEAVTRRKCAAMAVRAGLKHPGAGTANTNQRKGNGLEEAKKSS